MIGSATIFRRRLVAWYAAHRRDLPWRVERGAPATARPDPYAVLVSEAMLQQTQVATVIEFYNNFMRRFPTLVALAEAPEHDVLRAWQGLGYYSRARNLRRAARQIIERFDGQLPRTVDDLLTLPGVGRYTAGAIASLAYDVPAPIIDGNVIRVLCRIDLVRDDPRRRDTQLRLWRRAEELQPRRGAGDFNSAMMELGATVCTPRAPACLICPVRRQCEACAAGLSEAVPPPRKSKPTPLRRRVVLCLLRNSPRGPEALIERRPDKGRWAGMWQFLARPLEDAAATAVWAQLRREIGEFPRPRKMTRIRHQLTHRSYEFEVYAADGANVREPRGASPRWVGLGELSGYPLPRPHVMIASQITGATGTPPSAGAGKGGKTPAACLGEG